jgi:hypothetical protein
MGAAGFSPKKPVWQGPGSKGSGPFESQDASSATCCSSGARNLFLCHVSRTSLTLGNDVNGGIVLAPQRSMPSGAEIYRGYTVHWDIISSSDVQGWNAKVGIVSLPDGSGFCKIITITESRFESELEAREYVVGEAKKRVDEIVDNAQKEPLRE